MTPDPLSAPLPAPAPRTDRRRRPTSPWDAFRGHKRRLRARRADEEDRHYFIDRFPICLVAFAVLLLVLTLIDGLFTLILLEADCEELNPVMQYLLNRGPMTFLLGKYALTAAFLPVALTLSRCTLFGTRFRVGYLCPVFVALYVALISYQINLMTVGGLP